MGHVVVTGFQPWGKHGRNPSQLVAEALRGVAIAGRRVESVVLPVSYSSVDRELPRIHGKKPPLILHTGLHPSAYAVHVEVFALNIIDAGPDVDGVEKRGVPIVENGPAAYKSTMPVRRVVEAIRKSGVPARVSYSAGTFLCNYVFYKSLHLAGEETMVGFIHLPRTPEMAIDGSAPTMSLEMEVAAIRAAIKEALKDSESRGE